MKRRDMDILNHIIGYGEDIQRTMARFGADKSVFETDRDYRNSVCMSLLQIGELAGHLSDDYREATKSTMYWPAIKGMRNLIVHDYGATDIDKVWTTMTEDLPDLLNFCRKQVEQTQSNSDH